MLNLLWFLLPVAAAAGWFAARRSAAKHPDAFWDHAQNFHKGLNVLLNEQTDKSDEVLFANLDDLDRETAETHLALGNFFRRRGEVDRAIHLHQRLMEKSELGADVQAAARFELARDFESAGLLDRSESTFRELLDSGLRTEDTCKSLMQLYERGRDWPQATQVAKKALSLTERAGNKERSDKLRYRIAHYRCELADEAAESGQTDKARDLLAEAADLYPSGARAHMGLALSACDAGEWDEAIHHFEQVERSQPSLLPEIIKPWLNALANQTPSSGLDDFIKRVAERRNPYTVIRATREVIATRYDKTKANRFFKDQILKRPSLRGLRDWVSDQVEVAPRSEREKVDTIRAMLDEVIEDKAQYQCHSCGFKGNQLHWRCPSCGNWDSVQTIIGAEGE